MKNILIAVILFMWAERAASQNSYALIKPGTTSEGVIAIAARLAPSPRQLRWQQLELTAFFHYGINTYTDKEWGTGKEDPKLFNPSNLDPDQWVRIAKESGFKQVILTAKHHDGFCLWPTKTTTHSVITSPWKNGKGDVVALVAEACKKYNMGFGIYLSPWDMNSTKYGTSAYDGFFINQLTELLTEYGKVDEVWFDGANGEGPNGKKQDYDFNGWYALIRKLQPSAVIAIMGPDVRWVGTETGYGRETEWSVLPADNLDQNGISSDSQKDINIKPAGFLRGQDIGSRDRLANARSLVWYPAETDVSIRPGWFYHEKEDSQVKSAEKLMDIYYSSVGRNSVLLMNIPPNKNGLISDADIRSLKDWTSMRERVFNTNFADKSQIKSANGINTNALLDNDYTSYWTTSGNNRTAVIEIELRNPAEIDLISLQENITTGQRIEKFTIECWDGSSYHQVAQGTTVGYKRLIRFPLTKTQKVRLNIEQSRLNPTLSQLGIYKQ